MPKSAPEDSTWTSWQLNPYPGLRAFEPDEDYLYFGRQRQIDELLRRLRYSRFLAVVGTSGSGKSSLVRAGLVPSLHSGLMTGAGSSWRVAILRPGNDPVDNLAAALDDPAVLAGEEELGEAGRMILETTLRSSSLGLVDCVRQAEIPPADNVLLVVDQFEELFRYKRNREASRDQAVVFVKLLLEAAEADLRLFVVLTMRSDFIGDCMEFSGLPERINESLYLVPRMTRDELRLAITGPVKVRGGEISPRLVSRLLNDVGDDQDQLPVLQHALMRVWAHWEAHREGQEPVDVEHYEAVGTMSKALSRHAEKAYRQLRTGRQKAIAERLFRALTDTDRDGRGIRRPASVREICEIAGADPGEVIDVINGFRIPGRSFLMPPLHVQLDADAYVDLSHESLMRRWERLVRWSAEEAEAADLYRRLSEAAELYRAGQAGLWRPPELDVGLHWKKKNDPSEAWARRYSPDFEQTLGFLEESLRQRELYLVRREEKQRRELRRTRLLALFMALTVVLGGVVFLVYSHQLQENEQTARLQAVLSARDPLEKALLLAELEGSGGREWALEVAQRVAAEPIPAAILRRSGEALTSAAFTPEGDGVLAVSASGACYRWPSDGRGDPDPCRPREPQAAGGENGTAGDRRPSVTASSFSRTGEWLAAGFEDGTVRVRRAADSGRGEWILPSREDKVWAIAFSPDGERILVGYDDYSVRLWSRGGTGEVLGGDGEGRRPIRARTIGPKGGVTVEEVEAWHAGPVVGAAFDSTGARVATGSWDGKVRIWTLESPGDLLVFEGDRGGVQSVAFSADDRWVICGYSDGSALIWPGAGSAEPMELAGHDGSVIHASFSPDASKAVTASEDRTARVWNLGIRRDRASAATAKLELIGSPAILEGHAGPVTGAAFSADGARIVTVSEDGTARVWWSELQEPRILGWHQKRVESVDFSSDGRRLVTASDDTTVKVWVPGDPDQPPRSFEGHSDWVRSAAFSPGGEKVVSGSEDGTVRLWSLDSGKPRLFPESNRVVSVAFSPQGDRIVATTQWPPEPGPEGGREGHNVRIWRLDRGGREIGEPIDLSDHRDWVWNAAFSPDGKRMVTASRDTTARLWRLRGGGASSYLELQHESPVLKAAFSPDGRRVMTASQDGTARLWGSDGTTGAMAVLHELRHEDSVNDAAFSPGGAWVVTASKDGTARIWGVEDGRERLVLRHGSEVWAAAFRPRDPGTATASEDEPLEVATGSKDGGVRLWRVSLSALVEYANASSTGCLAPQQRVRFLAESQKRARSNYERCERRFGRTPWDGPSAR